MDTNPLLDRVMKVKKEEALHSSGYAVAGQGERIGSASAESFAARQAMEANRQVVGRYRDSKVGDSRNTVARAGGYDASKEAAQREAIRERFGGERNNGVSGRERDGASGGVSDSREQRFAGLTKAEGSMPTRRNPGISR